MITTNREDYIRAIYLLEEKKSAIRSIDVAKYLNISKPSVSAMIQELKKQKLVLHEKYARLKLTSKGKKIARRLTSKHRLIELFLKNVLKIAPNKIHEEAHRLEHAFSEESINQLRKLLGNPQKDPHGKPIP